MKDTKKILFGFFVALSLVCMLGIMSAEDASSPYTVTLKWIIADDTSFSVALCGSETTIDFDDHLDNQTTATNIEPNCQNASTSTPIATITNDGNIDLNFTCNLTAAIPNWATLTVNDENTYTGGLSFNTTAVLINHTVSASADTDVYLWTNVTSADTGTTERTYQINSVDADG